MTKACSHLHHSRHIRCSLKPQSLLDAHRYQCPQGQMRSYLKRMFDMTIHFRGFFAETMESRLILGAKVGVGFMGIKEDSDEDEVADGDITTPMIYVGGVYFSDALFRYLFKNSEFFKRLVIEMVFDFIFVASLDDVSLSEYSISAGYQFTDHFSASIFSEAFNTSTSLQNTSSWEIGGRLKLSY